MNFANILICFPFFYAFKERRVCKFYGKGKIWSYSVFNQVYAQSNLEDEGIQIVIFQEKKKYFTKNGLLLKFICTTTYKVKKIIISLSLSLSICSINSSN